MTPYLFPNFLNDPHEYEQAESLWRQNWIHLISSVDHEGLWQSPWLNTHFANGEPFRDGNPIFSAVAHNRQIGIRVIQVDPEEPTDLSHWIDVFADGEPDSIRELVITCALTNEALVGAMNLMKQWITEEKLKSSDEKQLGISGG
jgi:hypothetical protein